MSLQSPPPPPPENLPPPPPPVGYPPPGGYPPPPPPPGGFPGGQYEAPIIQYRPATTDGIPYASFWIRFAAAFIDGIIVSVALFAIFIVIGLIAGVAGLATGQRPTGTGSGVELLSNFLALVIYLGYFVYYWGMGQTPAMRIFHIAVVDETTGAPIGFGRSILRYLGYAVSVLACYVGLIWAAFDARKQGWHDKIAKTVVVQV